jgi:3-hydroxymyristoyl/3-hydroxydecanoyl-(acyl carrier protein) dehydratase
MTFLFVDRILSLEKAERIQGAKHVSLDDTYLVSDGGSQPYFMPSLIGEALGQLAAWNAMSYFDFKFRPVAGVCSKATIHRRVYPGETIFLESYIDSLDETAVEYHSAASVAGERVFTIEHALGPMLPMQQFIDKDVVSRQFQTICHFGQLPSTNTHSLLSLGHEIRRNKVHADFDELIEFNKGHSLVAVKKINRAAPYFADHFPLKPVLPLTILLEAKLRLAQHFILMSHNEQTYQANSVSKVKMSGFVQPGDILVCTMKLTEQKDDKLEFNFKCEVDGKRVCVARAAFSKVET